MTINRCPYIYVLDSTFTKIPLVTPSDIYGYSHFQRPCGRNMKTDLSSESLTLQGYLWHFHALNPFSALQTTFAQPFPFLHILSIFSR